MANRKMNVGELIKVLETMPPELPVFVRCGKDVGSEYFEVLQCGSILQGENGPEDHRFVAID